MKNLQKQKLETCIYCKKDQSQTLFSKSEHIIPQAFGRFEPKNLVLRCVCDSCNEFFGGHHDLILARDSMEALGRLHILKKWPKNTAFKRRRILHTIEEGPLKGSQAEVRSTADGSVEICPLAQVGLFKKSEKKYRYFLLNQIPEPPDLLEEYDFSHRIIFQCDTEDEKLEFFNAFEKRGIKLDVSRLESMGTTPVGKVLGRVQIHLDSSVQRAISKVLFNYLAYILSPGTSLRIEFDDIRQWIRYKERLSLRRFFPNQQPILVEDRKLAQQGKHAIRRGYLLALGWSEDRRDLVGRLSFYNLHTYKVILGSNFPIWWPISSAHYFDFESKKIFELNEARLLPFTP